MPTFDYSLAEQRPELYKNCRLPTPASVPVSYEGQLLCDVIIPESGVIAMDLPQHLVDRLVTGRILVMILSASLLPHHEFDDFQMVSITGIEMFDRV